MGPTHPAAGALAPQRQLGAMDREEMLGSILASRGSTSRSRDRNQSARYIEGSQMPRHLISDAHEWINEIPTVPIYYLAKPQPRERAGKNSGKEDPVEFDSSLSL